jgi:hypothetical protein
MPLISAFLFASSTASGTPSHHARRLRRYAQTERPGAAKEIKHDLRLVSTESARIAHSSHQRLRLFGIRLKKRRGREFKL